MGTIIPYVLSYQKQLEEYSEDSRIALKKYFDELGLNGDYSKIFLVDFVAAGSVQYFLEDVLECRMEGLYFSQMEKECYQEMEVQSFLGKYSNYKPNYYMQKYNLLLEALVLCPSGMCIGYDKKTKFRFREDERSSDNIAALLDLQEQSIAFFKRLRYICKNIDYSLAIRYIDYVFGLVCDGRIKLSSVLVDIFQLENYYDGLNQQNIFEWYKLKK